MNLSASAGRCRDACFPRPTQAHRFPHKIIPSFKLPKNGRSLCRALQAIRIRTMIFTACDPTTFDRTAALSLPCSLPGRISATGLWWCHAGVRTAWTIQFSEQDQQWKVVKVALALRWTHKGYWEENLFWSSIDNTTLGVQTIRHSVIDLERYVVESNNGIDTDIAFLRTYKCWWIRTICCLVRGLHHASPNRMTTRASFDLVRWTSLASVRIMQWSL